MIVFANLGLMSKILAVVGDLADHVVHVVGWRVGLRDDVEQLLRHAVVGVLRLRSAALSSQFGGEVGEVVLDRLDALRVVLDLEVADAGLAAVDLGAAQVLHRDVLAGDGLGQMGPGERHRALADDHRDEVREARDVGGAGGAGPEHRGDHRDHARHHHLLAEQVARAGEHRARRLLDACPGRVEQPDERHALVQRHLAQAADLDLAGHPHRAGHDGEVVRGDAAGLAVDVAPAGDDAVGGRLLAGHRRLGGVRAGRGCPSRRRCPRPRAGRCARAPSACRARAAWRSSPRRRRASPARGARSGPRRAASSVAQGSLFRTPPRRAVAFADLVPWLIVPSSSARASRRTP